jgi:single-strand DNA-binding protein
MELNLAVVRGPLSSVPDLRALPSGAEVANLAIRTPIDGKATSVPITVWDPPAWITDLDEGDELLVLGAVRRRFYRAGNATGSRVDVEATFVTRPGKRQLSAFTRRIRESLGELAG